ncbi:Msa family membrane protein [Aerococcus sp. UMB1112A]|uniref:Msa family membrane protein n=1 Tax=Aerococcus sp. UMB1112A TaxID=3050609 RepID=UPI003312F8DE
MKIQILSCIGHLILLVIALLLFPKISIIGAVTLLYLFPLIINLACFLICKKDKQSKLKVYSLSLISLIYYIILSVILANNGTWSEFAELNSYNNGQVALSVTNSPLQLSQIIFCFILYFGFGFILTLFIRRDNYESRN